MNGFHKYDLSAFAVRYGTQSHFLFNVIGAMKLESGMWIAGGAVRDFVRDCPIDSDVDVFFSSEEQFTKFLATQSQLPSYKKRYENEHQTTFTVEVENKTVKMQAIRFAYYADMEACLDSFDFTACQFATDGTSLHCGEFSMFDLARKRLAVHKVTYGASSVRRMLKYAKRGFTACQGCIVSLLEGMGADASIVRADIKYVD